LDLVSPRALVVIGFGWLHEAASTCKLMVAASNLQVSHFASPKYLKDTWPYKLGCLSLGNCNSLISNWHFLKILE
jgi:hypothetical protein